MMQFLTGILRFFMGPWLRHVEQQSWLHNCFGLFHMLSNPPRTLSNYPLRQAEHCLDWFFGGFHLPKGSFRPMALSTLPVP